jgi:hypothetical protein
MTIAGGVFAALLTIVVSHAASGWVANLVPTLRRRDPAFELLEYRSIRDAVSQDGLLDRASYVATNDWLRGAKIGYALGPAVPMLVLNTHARHLPFTTDPQSLIGKNGLLIVKVPTPATGPETWAAVAPFLAVFDTIRLQRTVPVLRGRDTALTVALFTTSNFNRLWREPLPAPAIAPSPVPAHPADHH